MAGLNEHLFHDILYAFHFGDAIIIFLLRYFDHFVGKTLGGGKIIAAYGTGGLEYGQHDLFFFEGYIRTVSLDDEIQHTIPAFVSYSDKMHYI